MTLNDPADGETMQQRFSQTCLVLEERQSIDKVAYETMPRVKVRKALVSGIEIKWVCCSKAEEAIDGVVAKERAAVIG